MEKQQQIQVLANLGWTDRAISRSTGIYRGTVAKYRKTFQNPPNVPTGSGSEYDQNQPVVPADLPPLPTTNSAQKQPYTEKIRDALLQRLTAQRIYH